MEKLAGDLLLGLKFVKLEILSTSFIDFLYDKLGELRLRSLGLKRLGEIVWKSCNSVDGPFPSHSKKR